MKLRTWHLEGLFVATSLATALVAFGKAGDWREWVAALGVQLGFHHASVADRMAYQQQLLSLAVRPAVPVIDAHRVHCFRWLERYWVGKELAWVAYFLATGAVSALVGCAVFLLHPLWRRWWRSRFPL